MNEEIKKDERRDFNGKKYLLVFILTSVIFVTGIILSRQLEGERVKNIKQVEESMYVDILSSEIQFSLLEDAGCEGLTEKTVLSSELRGLADKISFMDNDIKNDGKEFYSLKKKYQLLQIKDYLLMKKLSKKCKLNPINILFFYSKKDDKIAEETKKQFYVLDKLERDNPRLRVYYFDYDLPFSPVRTLIISKKVGDKMPAIIIENKVHKGFQSIEKIQKLLPKLEVVEEKYLKNFNGEESRVQIQCSEDAQCKIDENIFSPCGIPQVINIENKKEDIEEFSKIEKKLTNSIAIKCASLVEYKEEYFCNKKNVCEVKQKK